MKSGLVEIVDDAKQVPSSRSVKPIPTPCKSVKQMIQEYEITSKSDKSNERSARLRFEITSIISDKNYTTQSSITTSLHPF